MNLGFFLNHTQIELLVFLIIKYQKDLQLILKLRHPTRSKLFLLVFSAQKTVIFTLMSFHSIVMTVMKIFKNRLSYLDKNGAQIHLNISTHNIPILTGLPCIMLLAGKLGL